MLVCHFNKKVPLSVSHNLKIMFGLYFMSVGSHAHAYQSMRLSRAVRVTVSRPLSASIQTAGKVSSTGFVVLF